MSKRAIRTLLVVVIAGAAALSVAAVALGATSLSLTASKTALKYNKKSLTAKPGKVTIVMKNPSALSHDIAVRGKGVKKVGKTVGKGGTSSVTLNLKKGTYTFYCSVPGHEAAGMKGTLKVT